MKRSKTQMNSRSGLWRYLLVIPEAVLTGLYLTMVVAIAGGGYLGYPVISKDDA